MFSPQYLSRLQELPPGPVLTGRACCLETQDGAGKTVGPIMISKQVAYHGAHKTRLIAQQSFIMHLRLKCLLPVACLTTLFVPSVGGQEREADRRAQEEERGDRGRSPEAEAGPRRSPEDDRPRHSPEGERDGQRRSPETDRVPRLSPERDANRRASEGDRGARDADPLRGFRPQTEREEMLYRLVMKLREQLTRQGRTLRSRGGDRDQPRKDAGRTQDRNPSLRDNWQQTKTGKVFKAYDKNGDLNVSLEEWLAMTNGNISDARRAIQSKRYREADPNRDGRFTPAEFIFWYDVARHRDVERRGDRGGDRPAGDGDKARRSQGDREGDRAAPRDGDREKPGPRDGEREKPGARDGDRERGDRRDGVE